MPTDLNRRSVLATFSGLALGAAGATATTGGVMAQTSEDSFTIMAGTDQETTGYVRTAATDGPTAMVVGGIHGNERAGYEAAERVRELDVERGRLVVLPRANVVAIEDGTRTGVDGVDLNRQFPTGAEPTTELARAIWGLVEEYEPDVVIDLHESTRLYEGDVTEGVGQTIFHSSDDEARADAADAANYVNENHVDDSTYEFVIGGFSPEDVELDDLFVHKAARDADADAFLVETVSSGPTLETRIGWHTQIVERLVAEELTDGEEETEAEANEPPEAVIEPDPADAAERDFDEGETVVLDGSASSDPDGDVVGHEWFVDGEDEPVIVGPTAEIPLTFCGEITVELVVTDGDGATASEEITLSTV